MNRKLSVIASASAVLLLASLGLSCTAGQEQTARRQAPTVSVRLSQIGLGSVTRVASFSGTVQPRDQVNILPDVAGRIEKIYVDVGSEVKKGDLLVQLDTALLRAQMNQARAQLLSAQAALDKVLSGARQEDIEAARAALDSAEATHQKMLDGGRPSDIASAEAKVASARAALTDLVSRPKGFDIDVYRAALDSARSSLTSSEAKLADLAAGYKASDLQTALSAVNSGTAGLQSAIAKLNDLKAGYKASDIQAAQAAVDKAKGDLLTAEAKYQQLKNPPAEDVSAAQAAVDSAKAALAALKDPSPSKLAAAQATLDKAKSDLVAAENTLSSLMKGLDEKIITNILSLYAAYKDAENKLRADIAANAPPFQIDEDTRMVQMAWGKLKLAENELSVVRPNVTYDQLNAARASAQYYRSNVVSAEQALNLLKNPSAADLASAQSTLEAAQLKLTRLKEPAPADLAAYQAAVDIAKAALLSAQAKLDQLKAGPTEADLVAAQAAVDSGRASLQAAQAKFDQIKAGYSQADLTTAQSLVDSARASLDSAQAKLDQLKQGPTEAERQSAESALTQAEAATVTTRAPYIDQDIRVQSNLVAQARSRLSLTQNPYTERDVQAARATVAQAEANLEQAQVRLAQASIVAPFDGVVSKRYFSEGAFASTAATAPILTVVSSGVEVVFNVEEALVGKMTPGMLAPLAVSTYPGRVFQAVVSTVSPTAETASRTFAVKVAPKDQDRSLKGGMFADIKLMLEKHDDVVVVPKEALVQRGNKFLVFVAANNKAEAREVVTSLSDENGVEIVSGLTGEEKVIVAGHATLNDGDSIRVLSS